MNRTRKTRNFTSPNQKHNPLNPVQSHVIIRYLTLPCSINRAMHPDMNRTLGSVCRLFAAYLHGNISKSIYGCSLLTKHYIWRLLPKILFMLYLIDKSQPEISQQQVFES